MSLSAIFAPLDPPAPLLELPHELQQQAKSRIQRNLAQIVKRQSGTVFYKESAALSGLRSALGESTQGEPLHVPDTDEEIFQKFSRNVPFTSYDDYYPYVSRLIGEAPHVSEIEHLLAPGLPDFVARTTGTTGQRKYFPKYPKRVARNLPRWDTPEASMRVKIAQFTMLSMRQFIPVTGRDGETLRRIPLTIFSIGSHRRTLGIGPEDDDDIATKKGEIDLLSCFFKITQRLATISLIYDLTVGRLAVANILRDHPHSGIFCNPGQIHRRHNDQFSGNCHRLYRCYPLSVEQLD